MASNQNPNGRSVDAGRGWDWIAEGFGLFMKSPAIWIVILIINFALYFVLAIIHFIGGILINLIFPVFTAGIMLGCRALDEGEGLEIKHLFAGFQNNTGNLILVGLFYMIGIFIVMIPIFAIGFSMGIMGAMQGATAAASGILLIVLIAIALTLPLVMAVWFAPSLVVFNNLQPIEAMKRSFFGCLKNIIPFIIYGVIMLVLGIVAIIPLGLGLLVLGPVAMAAMYCAYKDIYLE